MRLYKAATTAAARKVIDHGFTGIPRWAYVDPDAKSEGETVEYVEFRDIPPAGLTLSRTTDVTAQETDEGVRVTVSGGPVLADDVGDFILSIEVPDALALEYEAREEPPLGWPFREFWLPPDVANAHRGSLVVFDSNDGEEVRLDLVGR